MPYVTVGKENSGNLDLYYEDHGSGKPIVLIHGYPLSGASWERQVPVLLNAGYRVITYDRRGFGKSSQPTTGYNYDTFAEDLHELVIHLELRDVTLVGFSMGGGEVARYLGKYSLPGCPAKSGDHLRCCRPTWLKTADNPEGVDASVFAGIEKAVAADRYAFFTGFFQNFYNTDQFLGKRVSEQAVQASWNIAATASATASLACVAALAWKTSAMRTWPRVHRCAHAGDSRGFRPHPSHHRFRTAHRQAHQRGSPAGREGRYTLHHVDARGRSKCRIAELPRREGRQVAEGGCLGNRP